LRTQLAFFRIHRTDKDEPRRVVDRYRVPFHVITSHCRGVEQHIDQVVGQQIHLIDIQDPAMSGRQQSRFESADAFGQCPFQVE